MSDNSTHELDLGREAMIGFSSNAAMMAFGFLGVVLFARVLGPAGLGSYYLVLAAGRTTAQLNNGIATAVKKRVAESETDSRAFLGVGLLSHLGIVIVVALLALLVDPFISGIVEAPHLVISITIIVFSLGFFQMCNGFYAGIGNPGRASWVDTVRSVLTLLFQVAFILAGWGAFGLVVAFAAASFLSGIGVWVAAGVLPRLPPRDVVNSTFEFARWSVPTAMTNDLYSRLDILLIGVIVGNEAVGFYETALRLAQPGAFFATSISGPLHVKASGLSSRSLDVIPDLENALAYCGLLTVPIFFGAIAMPVEIVRTVFGAEFTPAWAALIGLALFQVLNGYAAPFESIVSAIDQVRYQFGISTLILFIHAPLAILLGLRYGLIGVVGATIFGEIVRLTAYQYLSKRLLNTTVAPRPIATQLLAGAVMATVVYVTVEFFVTVQSWLWLVVVVTFGAAIYFGVLTSLSRHFRETLNNVLPVQVDYSR